MKIIEQDRISSFFGDELKMGGYLMRLTPLLIGLSFFFYDKQKHSKYLILSIIFILFINFSIYISGERTSFFLFNFSILLFIIFINNFFKIRILLFTINVIAISFFLVVESPFKQRLINFTLKQTQIDKISEEKYIFSKQYHEHYLSAWKIFKSNQLIGIGPKNFREICKNPKYNISIDTCSTHPHNIPLQLLSETGLIGFSIYLMLNIVVWFNLFKNFFAKVFKSKIYLNNFQISLLINIAILIWPFAPNGNLFNNWLSVIFYYPVIFSMVNAKIKNVLKFHQKNILLPNFILQIKLKCMICWNFAEVTDTIPNSEVKPSSAMYFVLRHGRVGHCQAKKII